jgi:hypothetical protein
MRDAVHSPVPNLLVSPLALPPPALRFEGVVSMDDCEDATEKRLPIFYYLYDTREERDAGSTLTAGLNGPKSGVHFREPAGSP